MLIDDVADVLKDKKLLDKLILLVTNGQSDSNNEYFQVCKEIWEDCLKSIKSYPRYEEFADVFDFDIQQVLNAMRFGHLVNTKTSLNNSYENSIYGKHGTMVVLHGTMDIMCSPEFDVNELGKVRMILNIAEELARLGNMFNTYPREIIENDISSPIITFALETGLISLTEFRNLHHEEVGKKLKPLENMFHERSETLLKNMTRIKMNTIDSNKFVQERKFIHDEFLKRINYWEK